MIMIVQFELMSVLLFLAMNVLSPEGNKREITEGVPAIFVIAGKKPCRVALP